MTNRKPLHIQTHISRKLKRRREELNLKQKELAHLLGITPQQFSKYERKADNIPAHRLYQLCKILAVTPNYFFDGLEEISLSSSDQSFWLSCENIIGQRVHLEMAEIYGTIRTVKISK